MSLYTRYSFVVCGGPLEWVYLYCCIFFDFFFFENTSLNYTYLRRGCFRVSVTTDNQSFVRLHKAVVVVGVGGAISFFFFASKDSVCFFYRFGSRINITLSSVCSLRPHTRTCMSRGLDGQLARD